MGHDSHDIDGDNYLDIEATVTIGTNIRVRYPTDSNTIDELEGTVTQINEGHSICFENDGSHYILRRYGHKDYQTKTPNIRVLHDLNPGGKTHLNGLNNQGDPAEVELHPTPQQNP